MTDLKIRSYLIEDRDQLISLWDACGLIVPQNDALKDIERKLDVDPDLFLVGLLDQEIVATVMGGYEGHRGWINYLAVKPSERRKGYGQQIMMAVEARIKKRGCPKINLQVRAKNQDAIAFYAALGYDIDDVVGLGKRLKNDA